MSISSLDPAIPADSSFVGDGAAEIRSIKDALVATFPAVNGAITKPSTYGTAGTTEPTEADFSQLFTDVLSVVAPDPGTESPVLARGMVMSWFGDPSNAASVATLTAKGWYIANGQSVNGYTTPNLQGKFIKCDNTATSGASPALSATATTTSPYVIGTTTAKSYSKISEVTLNEGNIPRHIHMTVDGSTYGLSGGDRPQGQVTASSPTSAIGSSDNPQYALATPNGGGSANVGPTSPYGNSTPDPISISAGATISEFDHEHRINRADLEPAHFLLAYICYVGVSA